VAQIAFSSLLQSNLAIHAGPRWLYNTQYRGTGNDLVQEMNPRVRSCFSRLSVPGYKVLFPFHPNCPASLLQISITDQSSPQTVPAQSESLLASLLNAASSSGWGPARWRRRRSGIRSGGGAAGRRHLRSPRGQRSATVPVAVLMIAEADCVAVSPEE
jgi:hypothetical protein